jgi:hydrogenase-4 component F
MDEILMLLLTLPVAVGLVCLRIPARAAGTATAACGVACFGLVLAVVPTAAHGSIHTLRFLRVDAVSAVFMLATGFLYAAVAVYAVGYMSGGHPRRAGDQYPTRYSRRLWVGLNLFAWAMLAAPMMSNLALLWVAIEVTTVISALLVAIEDTGGAAEAAWKYVLLASTGLGLALLATIFAYYAGAQVFGQSYDLGFAQLLAVTPRLPHAAVQLAFVLAVLGFGTKMGLVPVHTWLPDAHSEAPTPVSALLSGSLLAVSFYAILRYYQVAEGALGPRFPRTVLLVFGVASLLLAALYLFGQRDIKRLLAYSSVEHMGILAIAVSFGVPAALAGALLHVLAHAAAKGNAFMGAGVFVRKFGTKRIAAIRGGLDVLPWSGPLFLLAVFALGAMPPFGLFRSEFEIVAGGLGSGSNAAAAILIVGVTIAFLGLATSITLPLLPARQPPAQQPARPPAELAPSGAEQQAVQPAEGQPDAGQFKDGPSAVVEPAFARGEPSGWMVVPVVAGALMLLILGLHPPAELNELFGRAVRLLSGAGS